MYFSALACREECQLKSIGNASLFKYASHMVTHGERADSQLSCDAFIWLSLCEMP